MALIVKKSFADFYVSYKKHLTFAFIYMLLTSFLFVPVISYLFNRVLKAVGTGSLMNAEVYRIGLTTSGFAGMLLISLLAVIILFFEFGVMVTIAHKTYFRNEILISEAFMTALKKLPSLLGLGLLQFVLIFMLIIPFVDSPVFPALLDLNMPILFHNVFRNMSDLLMMLIIILTAILLFFVIRLVFSFHYIFIEGKKVWPAMVASWKLARSNKTRLVVSLILFNLLLFISGFLILALFSTIPDLTGQGSVSRFIENSLITVSSFAVLVFTLLVIPLNIIILTRLYYLFRQTNGDDIADNLSLHRVPKLSKIEQKLRVFFKGRKKLIGSVIAVFLSFLYLINYTVADNMVYLKWNVQIAAHRGDLHSSPENSLSAIQAAMDKGVDAVEIDVMLTEDDVLVLHHDYTLERMAALPDRLEELSFDKVSQIDIGSMFSEEFAGETIPTLSEALYLMKDENVNVIIDIKLSDLNRSPVMAREIVEAVEEFELEDRAYVQAFEYEPLQEVRKLNDEIPIGQIFYLAAGDLSLLDVDFYTVRQTMLTERFVENARNHDREVWVWTVNHPHDIREVLKYDIDGIITDYPERVQSITGIDLAED